jgi:hypothetical protein
MLTEETVTFSQEDKIKFKRYCQEIIDNPRPIDGQPHVRGSGCLWCEDWKIIEYLKYFFNGEEMYLSDPPPKRLKNNPLWSKAEIIKEARIAATKLKTAKDIIEKFREKRKLNAPRFIRYV